MHKRLDLIEINFLDARREEKNWLLFGKDKLTPEENSHLKKFKDTIARVKMLCKEENELVKMVDVHASLFEEIVASRSFSREQIYKLRLRAREVEAKLEEQRINIDRLVNSSQRKAFAIIGGTLFIALILCIFMAKRISSGIISSLNQLKDFAGALAGGDLDHELTVSSQDEIGDLALSFDEMRKKLKKSQEQLIKSERLSTIGQLAAHVGHELRNPLSVIKSSVYYLNMKFGDIDKKIQEHLQRIEKQVMMSNKIISDLLGFSRVKPPGLSEVRLNDIIEETISSISIPERVKVVKNLKGTLPFIGVDKNQMHLVFVNLVLNAFDAMPEGGELYIKTGEKEGFQEIEFKDTGCGIPEEDRLKIFDALFSSKQMGVGLGLTLCKSLVEGHGGRIEIDSQVGMGTTFTIMLPFVGGARSATG